MTDTRHCRLYSVDRRLYAVTLFSRQGSTTHEYEQQARNRIGLPPSTGGREAGRQMGEPITPAGALGQPSACAPVQ